jgi:phage terminase large subunit-like protein
MLDTLTADKARAALEKLEAIKAQRKTENKLATFTAYKKQRDFFAAGKTHRERRSWRPTASGKPSAAPLRCPII